MKSLIVEDDFACRRLLQLCLAPYGECDIAINGIEGLYAFKTALQGEDPYDLICLDIMMPEMDGHEALTAIRSEEGRWGIRGHQGVKVIMITSLKEPSHIMEAFREGCEAYLVKPINKRTLVDEIEKLRCAATERSEDEKSDHRSAAEPMGDSRSGGFGSPGAVSGIRAEAPLPDPTLVTLPDDFAEFLNDYVDSVDSQLHELEQAILRLEGGQTREQDTAAIRRILHKIKGESALLGLGGVSQVVHEVESAFEEISPDQAPDMVFRFCDWMKRALVAMAAKASVGSAP